MVKNPLQSDFRVFLTMLWRHLDLPDPTPRQIEIANFLQHGAKRRYVSAFRGVGKSWITAAYVLWRLYVDPDLNILVVSASSARSIEFTQFCQRIISEWDVLKKMKGSSGGSLRWTSQAFDVASKTKATQQPSVKAAGITGQITGSRADEIIADDIEVPANSATQTMRDILSERMKEFSAILTPKPESRITILGTPQSEQTVYHNLEERGYETLVIPARVPTKDQIDFYGSRLSHDVRQMYVDGKFGAPTDIKRFTDFELTERELEYGRAGFSLQFMLNTQLSDLEKYPLKINDLTVMNLQVEQGPDRVLWSNDPKYAWEMDCVGLTGDRYYRNIPDESQKWMDFETTFMSIDPSGRGADETAVAVVKRIGSLLFLVEIKGYKGGFDESTLTDIAKLAAKHKTTQIIVESNFGDGMFTALFQPILMKYHRCQIEDIRHNTQKEKRICDVLEPVLNQHRLIIDKACVEDDYRSTEEYPIEEHNKYRLLYQLARVTRDKGALATDDRLDALAMAVAHHVEAMKVDNKTFIKRREDKLWEEENKKFFGSNDIFAKKKQKSVLGVGRDNRGRKNRRSFRV
jgi:hypothetical protein